MRGVLKPFLDLILCQGSYSVSRGSCCIKGLMLYQGAHAVSTVSQLARGSDEYRNGLGIKGTLESVSIRFRYIDIKIYEPILSATTMNLPKDLGLVGQQPNIALTIFFVPYVIFEIPSNILMKRFQPHIWRMHYCELLS